jgi:hypothetical protein
MPSLRRLCTRLFVVAWMASPAFAGFASTETFLPAVGRVSGQGGAQFYTTVWATNLTAAPISFTFNFLKQGQANANPAKFTDTLAVGETKVYENVVEAKLGLTSALGAARITATGEILVAERIYNQAPGADPADTEGLFFAGVPKTFSISAGQSASIQGIDQGGSENFRYNFALVETGGGSPTVNVQVFDGAGVLLGQKAYPLQPYEQLQPNVAEIVAGIHTTNARITAIVTGGTGSVLLAGAQLANISQDSSGFEMSFRDDILGSGGTAGVTSLNGLTGALTIAHGANTTVNVSGSTITIDAVAGSGTGLTAVAHDNTLAGSGTAALPLGVANGQVVRSLNGLHDAVTLAAGSNVTLTPSGSTITIAAAGGGGLTLPFQGADNHTTSFAVTNTADKTAIMAFGGSGSPTIPPGDALISAETNGIDRTAVSAYSHHGKAVEGDSDTNYGIVGVTDSFFGVFGDSVSGPAGVFGHNGNFSGTGVGVSGESEYRGVEGSSVGGEGVYGSGHVGVHGVSTTSRGVFGEGFYGVYGSGTNYGVYAQGGFGGTGAKYFVEPHPTDPGKEIRFVCLEGPESGTYFRGSSRTVNGIATIEVPESFRMVTDDKNLTVVLAPMGELAVLACVKKSLDTIVIQSSKDVEFDYVVNGVRKAFKDHEAISENKDFVPRSATDPHFTMGLPAESIRRLETSGILNSDGSINLETAHRLGWDQKESWKRAEAAGRE